MIAATAAVAVAIDSATIYSTTKAATTVSTIAARGVYGRQPWDILWSATCPGTNVCKRYTCQWWGVQCYTEHPSWFPLVAYICAVWARGHFDHQGRWCWHMWSPSYLLRFPPPTMMSTSPYPMWWGKPYFLEVVPHHIIVQVYTGVEEVGVSQEIKNRGGTLPPPPSGIVPEWPAQLAYTLPLLPPRRCLESPDQI